MTSVVHPVHLEGRLEPRLIAGGMGLLGLAGVLPFAALWRRP